MLNRTCASRPWAHDGDTARSRGLAEASGGRVRFTQQGEVHIQLRLVRVGLDAELVGGVLAEPVNVLGQVRRDAGQVLRLDRPALLQELADDLRDVQGVVKNDSDAA
jgi:hypothetical protein